MKYIWMPNVGGIAMQGLKMFLIHELIESQHWLNAVD